MLVLAQCTSLLNSIYSDSTHVPAIRKRRRTEEKDTAQLSHLSLQCAVLADMAVCGLHRGGSWGLGSSLSKHCPPAEALQARSQDATCMHVAMMAWHEAAAPRRQVCLVRFAGGQPSHEREHSAQPRRRRPGLRLARGPDFEAQPIRQVDHNVIESPQRSHHGQAAKPRSWPW
jgi:hypothetical protein